MYVKCVRFGNGIVLYLNVFINFAIMRIGGNMNIPIKMFFITKKENQTQS